MSQKLALIIGNSEYDDASLARLITPAEDTNDLATVLMDPGIGGFDAVSLLLNETFSIISRAIARFFMQKKRDDLLLLYFSGHGVLDDQGHLYLAVKDTERDLLRGTAIPAAYITDEMDHSRSRRQVLILDCCHSGAFARGSKGAPGASVGTASAFEGIGYGRVVLTATDSTQYAWEGDQVIGVAENSVFTHYLVQGLHTGEADTDADGRITLDELYDYVYEQVVSQTPKQTPGKWSYRQQGEIVIAHNPRPMAKPVGLLAELQQSIEDPRPWVREGAARQLGRLLSSSDKGLALSALETLQGMANDDSQQARTIVAEILGASTEAKLIEKAESEDKMLAVQTESTEDKATKVPQAEPSPPKELPIPIEQIPGSRKVEVVGDAPKATTAAWFAQLPAWAKVGLSCGMVIGILSLLFVGFFIWSLTSSHPGPLLYQWQVSDGQLLQTLTDPAATSFVQSLAFSPDGSLLASAGFDIDLWRMSDGHLLQKLFTPTKSESISFSPDGETFAAGGCGREDENNDCLFGEVRLFRITEEGFVSRDPMRAGIDKVNSLAFSPDGSTLALTTCLQRAISALCSDSVVRFINVPDGTLLGELAQHTKEISSVAFSPDGTLLATGSWDTTARLWRVPDGQLLQKLEHGSLVESVAFSPDGTLLATGSSDENARLWQVSDGKLLQTLAGHTHPVESVAFSLDGAQLASAGGDIRLWQVSDGQLLQTLSEQTDSFNNNVVFSPDGLTLVGGEF